MKLVVPAIISLLLLSSIGHSQSHTVSPSSVDSLSNKTIVGNSNRISAVCVSPACSYMPGTPDFFLDSGSSYTGTAQTFLLDVGLNGYVFQGNGVSQTVGFLNSRLYNQATANGVIGNGAVATTVEAANTGTCSFCYSSLKAINQGGHLAELVVTAPSFNNNGVSYLPQGTEGEAAFLAIDGGLPFAIGDRNNNTTHFNNAKIDGDCINSHWHRNCE